jgi:AmmeMemoRadiSam system protein A
LLSLARQTIAFKVRAQNPPAIEIPYPRLKEERGAFVTLLKRQNLRGCIGYIRGAKPLFQSIRELAELAAFYDPRFEPLDETELKDTSIEISVLSSLRKINSIRKIKVPQHGLFVRLGNSQGLLLPQVAEKHHWDCETFLGHVCLKAELPRDAWRDPAAEIMIFEAQIFLDEPKREPSSFA